MFCTMGAMQSVTRAINRGGPCCIDRNVGMFEWEDLSRYAALADRLHAEESDNGGWEE